MDPIQALERFDANHICAFLSWKAKEIAKSKDHPRMSTILTYYKRLQSSLLEAQEGGQRLVDDAD